MRWRRPVVLVVQWCRNVGSRIIIVSRALMNVDEIHNRETDYHSD